jgi:hypothetical protein
VYTAACDMCVLVRKACLLQMQTVLHSTTAAQASKVSDLRH